MARHKNQEWGLPESPTVEQATLAALMDIRDELQGIRRILECPNVRAAAIATQKAAQATARIDKRLAKRTKL